MRRSILSLALILPLASTRAAAQGEVVVLDSAALAALAALAPRIDSADVLRLSTLWGNSILVQPRLVPSGLEYRTLTGDEPRIDGRAFALQRPGRATGTGALAGGILLGALGAGLGAFVGGWGCSDRAEPCTTPIGYGIGFGVLGATVGAAIGGMIGSRITRWHTIYQHPDP
jgi:hypothetical protein